MPNDIIEQCIKPHRHINIQWRLWDKLELVGDCWIWIGNTTPDGYGIISICNKQWYVHRLMYTLCNQNIDPSLVIDHLCRNRNCANPHHLEEVTNRENLNRGIRRPVKFLKTHCKYGHEFTPENTRHYERDGTRFCRICDLTRTKRYEDKKRALIAGGSGKEAFIKG